MIITTLAKFFEVIASAPGNEIVVDVETRGTDPQDPNSRLLGVSICWDGIKGIYIPIDHHDYKLDPDFRLELRDFLLQDLIGWNIEFDRKWIDHYFEIESNWARDVRCMWYLTDKEQVERGYGLKRAQVKLLGWTESGDQELKNYVARMGGKLDKGDHYLASVPVLGKYANLDTYSTMLCDQLLSPIVDSLNYWDYLDKLQKYGNFLSKCTELGVNVDVELLKKSLKYYEIELLRLEGQIRSICKDEIIDIEETWHRRRIRGYKSDSALRKFIEGEGRKKFNVRSGPHKSLLLHEYLGVKVTERTPSGLPKSSRDVFETMDHPVAKLFVQVSETAKLLSFTQSYLECIKNGRIHFPHNWCATVTGRLGGFKPYDLNMPFSEERIMKAFKIEDGYTGIHMDLKAVEPTVIAAFSHDPNLVRLYRDGMGDVYLDLALELFPTRSDLKAEYDPLIKTPSEIKVKFKQLRDVAKIVHLAVGYTGTAITVSSSLTKAGFPTTVEEAKVMVNRYWSKYTVVRQFEEKLQALYDKQGYLQSLGGGYIWVPKKFKKDLLNRFTQRSGHDVLVEFINTLYSLARRDNVLLLPVLPDIHDSHSAKCKTKDVGRCLQLFEEALSEVNKKFDYGIKFGMEVKTYKTFFGLKGIE